MARAFDHNLSAVVQQKTGGISQSLTNYAVLSGGAWLPGSYAMHNYSSIDDLEAGWRVNINRFGASNDSRYAAIPATMSRQIYPKFVAGFDIHAL